MNVRRVVSNPEIRRSLVKVARKSNRPNSQIIKTRLHLSKQPKTRHIQNLFTHQNANSHRVLQIPSVCSAVDGEMPLPLPSRFTEIRRQFAAIPHHTNAKHRAVRRPRENLANSNLDQIRNLRRSAAPDLSADWQNAACTFVTSVLAPLAIGVEASILKPSLSDRHLNSP